MLERSGFVSTDGKKRGRLLSQVGEDGTLVGEGPFMRPAGDWALGP